MTRKKSRDRADVLSPEQPTALPHEANSETRPFTIVGLGASAGGLKALQLFFGALSENIGMAFVVVTHLHPEHESVLAELIQSHTHMPVNQVKEMVVIQPDHVYVIPPNRNIILTDSHLNTTEFDEPRGLRSPIDTFFRSLAAAHGEAIAVILSGGGTDGSVGVKAIKEAGGLILVQEPREAAYDSMPRAAIATGLADVVLPVRELVEKLVRLRQQPIHLPLDPEALTAPDMETVLRILGQVHSQTGHDFSQYKRSTILRRIQRRMQLNGFATLDAYLDYLNHQGEEAHLLFNDLLIGVTNFFRDRDSWESLAEKVIPQLFAGKGSDESIRVWAIGCSTGEEAYSLAILLLEHASTLDKRPTIQIFASDLDKRALMRAREGIYPEAIEADVSAERLQRFFVKDGHYYQTVRELRDIVVFADHSVLRDPPFSRLDLISCRNLLIYLQRDMQERVFELFHYALRRGMFLFLGSSESAEVLQDLFRAVDKTHRLYQTRPRPDEYRPIPLLPLVISESSGHKERATQLLSPQLSAMASADTFHERELEAYGPPSLLINQEYQILHVSETAGRYLMPRKGPITKDLLKVIRPELQYELRSILFRAFEKKKAVISAPIYLDFTGHTQRVILSVRLRPRDDQARETDEPKSQMALLLFIEDEPDELPGDAESQREEREKSLEADGHANTMVEQLEKEVRRLRYHLQVNIEKYEGSNEELKAANEELQSINEEYRATTEELETSKEELHSINEELQTVNNELKSKVEELSQAHGDLENLMAATEFGTLFLDRELCIKRYTPGTERLLNIRPTDKGRPIAHLTNKLSYDNLPRDAAQVLQQLTPVEREVRGPQGEWFLVRLRPYRTVDDLIDGVVVTFVDVTELKQIEIALRERENELTLAQQAAWAGFWALDLRTKKATVSVVWREIMGLIGESESQTLAEMLHIVHVDDRPRVASIGARRWRETMIYELEFRINHPTRGWRWILSRHRPLVAAADGQLRLYGFVMDITARKQMEEALHEREQELRQLNETLESKVNERTQTIQDLAAQLTRAEQEERQRIAQILHDELQQRLYTVQVQLQFLRDSITETSPELVEIEFKEMGKWLTDAIETTRRLSIDLSPPILRDEGLVQAIKWLASQMKAQYGLKVDVQVDAGDSAMAIMDKNLHVLLFQLVRELLFNVVKHAGVTHAHVSLAHVNNSIRIDVSDEGQGFDPEVVRKRKVPRAWTTSVIGLILRGVACKLNLN